MLLRQAWSIPHGRCSMTIATSRLAHGVYPRAQWRRRGRAGEGRGDGLPLRRADRLLLRPCRGQAACGTAPMLLAEVDNTKLFTFTAKVTPGFTPEGMYTAADLFVFAGDRLWQKLAFEQDERGNHRVVSVRTRGTYPSAMPVFFMPFLLRLLSRSAPAARGPGPGPPRRRGRRARLRGCASRS